MDAEQAGRAAGDKRMGLREWMAVLGITFTAFVFNTSEFIPIGLLTNIGESFGMDASRAGSVIVVYAWAVTLLSVPLMLPASRFALKRLLLATIAVFAAGQAVAVLSQSYAMLVAARLVVACAHCIFWGIAAPIAVRIVPDRAKPLALSLVATGTSIAMILGLPLGRAIGLALGWRMAFLSVGVAAAAAFVYLLATLPALAASEPFRVAQFPQLIKNRRLLGILAMIILIVTGYYLGYGYIEPFLLNVAGLPDFEVTAVLTVFGAFGIVGSLLFARLYDGHRIAFLLVQILTIAVALALLLPAASAGVVAVVALAAVWGIAGSAFNVALQAEELACVPEEAATVCMSMYSGTFNLGIGLGTALGGVVAGAVGLPYIGFVGALVVVPAAVICVARPSARRAS